MNNLRLHWSLLTIYLSTMMASAVAETLASNPAVSTEVTSAVSNSDMNFLNEQLKAAEKSLQQKHSNAQKNTLTARIKLTTAFENESSQLSDDQIRSLMDAEHSYNQELTRNQGQISRPFSLLNLAQVQLKLGIHYKTSEKSAIYSNAARKNLQSITEESKNFEKLDEAWLLLAKAYLNLKNKDAYHRQLSKLARMQRDSIYVFQANFILGNHYYEQNDYSGAKAHFAKAWAISEKVAEIPLEQRAQSLYWLSWSAYQDLHMREAASLSAEFLRTKRFLALNDYPLMKEDLCAILARLEYELQSAADIAQYITADENSLFAGALAINILNIVLSEGNQKQINILTKGIMGRAQGWDTYPRILQSLSYYHATTGQLDRQISYLEQLALLLPVSSLWRELHKTNTSAIKDMEANAYHAAKIVAFHHYKMALASDKREGFNKARSFFKIIFDHHAEDQLSQKWLIYIANCLEYEGNHQDALTSLLQIKETYRLNSDELKSTQYLIAIAYSNLYQDLQQRLTQPSADNDTLLNKFNAAVQELADQFPGSNESITALGLAANINKDSGQSQNAKRFWQSLLADCKSTIQRASAIRGLLYLSTSIDTPQNTIALTRQFLKTENWRDYTGNLRQEIVAVLSVAMEKERDRLKDNGEYALAGAMLSDIAQEFPEDLDQQKIMKEAAVLHATVGDWKKVETITTSQMQQPVAKYAAQLSYLKAQSLEQLLKFDEAAAAHMAHAEKHPRDQHALSSATSARDFYLQSEKFQKAALAEELRFKVSKRHQDRIESLTNAIKFYAHINKHEDAYRVAKNLLATADSRPEKLAAQVYEIKMAQLSGRASEADIKLNILQRQINAVKGRIPAKTSNAIVVEIEIIKAEKALAAFDQINIQTGDRDFQRKLTQKSASYSKLKDHLTRAAGFGIQKTTHRSKSLLSARAAALANDFRMVLMDHQLAIAPEDRQRLERQANIFGEEQRLSAVANSPLMTDSTEDSWLAFDTVPANVNSDDADTFEIEKSPDFEKLKTSPKDPVPFYDSPLQYAH